MPLDNGVETIAIDDVTGFQMMDGRVKTLHQKYHGRLNKSWFEYHLEKPRDNPNWARLYPFKETILKPDVTYADAGFENIDISG